MDGRAILSIIGGDLEIMMKNTVPRKKKLVHHGSHNLNRTTLAFRDLRQDLRSEGIKSDVATKGRSSGLQIAGRRGLPYRT